jgi:hypothetical protein
MRRIRLAGASGWYFLPVLNLLTEKQTAKLRNFNTCAQGHALIPYAVSDLKIALRSEPVSSAIFNTAAAAHEGRSEPCCEVVDRLQATIE